MISVSTGGGTRARAYASPANTSSACTTYATSSLVEFEAHRRGRMVLILRIR